MEETHHTRRWGFWFEKDAIFFKSIPSISDVVPGGRPAMELWMQLAMVPFVEHDAGHRRQPPSPGLGGDGGGIRCISI